MTDSEEQIQIHLRKILEACETISDYVSDFGQDSFTDDQKTVEAVVWNLDVISQAIDQLPENVRNNRDSVDWEQARAYSNVVTHHYFGVNHNILKDIIADTLPEFEQTIREFSKQLNDQTDS